MCVLVQFYKSFCTKLKDITWKSAMDADEQKTVIKSKINQRLGI